MQMIYSRHKLKSSSWDTPKLCQAIRPRRQTGGRHQYRHDFSGLHVSAVPTHCNLCETRDPHGSKLTVLHEKLQLQINIKSTATFAAARNFTKFICFLF